MWRLLPWHYKTCTLYLRVILLTNVCFGMEPAHVHVSTFAYDCLKAVGAVCICFFTTLFYTNTFMY